MGVQWEDGVNEYLKECRRRERRRRLIIDIVWWTAVMLLLTAVVVGAVLWMEVVRGSGAA